MSTTYITFNIVNNSRYTQNFYLFQQPVRYGGARPPFANSLFTSPLTANQTTGATLTFAVALQYYAAAQQGKNPPQIGQPSGQPAISQPIELASSGDTRNPNSTTMTIEPTLGLSVPAWAARVPPNSFRIVTPAFNPEPASYNAGLAVQTMTGSIVMSSFVTADPNSFIDLQPVPTFFIQTGAYPAGAVIDFADSSITAAVCDAGSGYAI
jgi:hypothetical protein